MLPTLRQLQYLKLLAEHGSFSRAAEAAHVSQPALSAGVQELERILGAPVVERARGAVIMTAVGAEAVRRAEDVLARTEDLVEAAKNAGRLLSGRFRLGVIPTVAPFLLPAKLPSVKAAYPSLKLFIREDLTPRLIAALKAGQIDAAVIALPYDAPGIAHARIGDDEIMAAAPADHALAAPGPIGPGSLRAEDLILLEDGHCLRDHALAALDIEATTSSPPPACIPWSRWSDQGWASPSCPRWRCRRVSPTTRPSPSAPSRIRPTGPRPAARSWSPGAPAPAARPRPDFWPRP